MALAPVFCAHCGAANEVASKSCFACGHVLGETGNAASVQAELVKQRYRVVRQVGTGGFGAVYLAEDTLAKNQPVALKRINLAGLKAQEIIEATDAFNREVSLLPGLRHPHLPRVFDHFTDPDHWYLVMQFIEGETLEDYVQKRPARRLSVEAVIDIGIQLAEVLHYLHSQQPPIIFRDLKPANIMRTPRGELYLIDFGIARLFKPGQARDTIAFGSPGYAPPEQYGKAQTTAQADLYSLGATLHALLTGDDPANAPFAFAPLSLSAQPAITHLERLIMQMVALDADKRPASARAVKQELQDVATELLEERLRALYPVNMPTSGYVQPYVPPSANGASAAGQIQVGMSAQAVSARRGRSRRRFMRISAGVILTTVVGGGLMQLLGNLEQNPGINTGLPSDSTIPPLGSGSLGTRYYVIGDTSFVRTVAWSPDGNSIASGGYDLITQVFDAASANRTARYDYGLAKPVVAVAWSPNSQYIASVDGTVQVWDVLTENTVIVYYGHRSEVNMAAWSPDGNYIVSAAENVQVWNALSGSHIGTRISTYKGHNSEVTAVAWSPDGSRIASGGKDGTVRIWKPFEPEHTLVTYQEHHDQINSVSWSPDGKYIASTGNLKDTVVRVWDTHSGNTVLPHLNSTVIQNAAWSPDGKRIASAGNDNAVQIWNPFTGDMIFIYSQHGNEVSSISWSPDGKCIASGSFDDTIHVWQAV